MAPEPTRYDVARSFAGEDRAVARQLAQRLQTAGYAVFFDEYERAELWGESLPAKLWHVYEHQSRYCVPFVSRTYIEKPWTRLERSAALSRAVRERTPYVLPLQLDDSELPGLPSDTAYLDMRQVEVDEVFAALAKKLGPPSAPRLGGIARGPSDPIVRVYPRNVFSVVITEARPRVAAFNLDCHIVNQGEAPASIRRLEAYLTPPGGSRLQLSWELVYDYLPSSTAALPVQMKTDDADVRAKESQFLGIQFVGPRLEPEEFWVLGTYGIELYGWVNHRARHEHVDLRTRFELGIGLYEAAGIRYWSDASRATWDRLNDPDRAIGIPGRLDERSIAAA
ncbi:MAG TPA: toll/interleukin-1 receptor domain-containing protein [Chloroflexota bacterium]|nr:toll/interleukin-1 receptor domain-containing protein [Chloroflexota bacterium]